MNNKNKELTIYESRISQIIGLIFLWIIFYPRKELILTLKTPEYVIFFAKFILLYITTWVLISIIFSSKILKIDHQGITLYNPQETILWKDIYDITVMKHFPSFSHRPNLTPKFEILIYLNKENKKNIFHFFKEIKRIRFNEFTTKKIYTYYRSTKILNKYIDLYWQKKTKDQELNEYFEEKN